MLQPSQAGIGNEQGGLLYDYLSSFDPLQAHAFQLTASAGLTNLLAPAPSCVRPVTGAAFDTSAHQQQQPTVFNLHSTGHPPQTQANSQQPYFYMQPASAPAGLHPIAPASPPGVAPGYILPAPGYTQKILPSALPGVPSAAGAAALPNHLLMSQHLQNVVVGAAQHPPPLAPAMPSSSAKREMNPVDGQPAKKHRELAPSMVSLSTNLSNKNDANNNSQLDCKPPVEATQAELDRMTPAERRRYERNLREQQRSYKISQQIKELRDVLAESNVPFKPNKYSILLSVVDYIKQLQARAIMLDAEHQKLITTIRQTNEMVNSGTAPSSADEDTNDSGSENEMLFVQGLDYRSVFVQCPAALGIASLDGRILECNPEFQELIGCQKNDLLKQSLFNLVKNHQDIFRAMAEMLKVAEVPGQDPASLLKHRFWSGEVVSNINVKVRVSG
jgi:PAS domain-containing protein